MLFRYPNPLPSPSYICHVERIYAKLADLFIEPRFWWFRHLLFWFYRFNPIIFGQLGVFGFWSPGWEKFVFNYLLPDLFLVYANYLILVPRFLMRRKILWYLLFALLINFVYAYFTFYFFGTCEDCTIRGWVEDFYFDHYMDGLEVLVMTTGPRLILEYFYTRTHLKEVQNDSLNAELAFLKSQINPHFLFNTLNNIAVLSEKYPDRVTDTVVQLSKILRYQLYESEKDLVPLEGDIENLRNFLDLEAIRLFKVDASIEVEGRPEGLRVAPLMFLPFLENAVKHSADPRNRSFIKIKFKIDGKKVVFTAENSKPTVAPISVAGGIGLKNLRRRLELLYPKRHRLEIDDQPEKFAATLELNLEHG